MSSELATWIRPWYNKYAVMTLSAAIGFGAYETVPWACLTASDWGTWVGSIGTVLTLVGTIWLATADRRQVRKEANDRAVVAAAAIGPRLQRIGETLQNVVESVLDDGREKNAMEYRSYADMIESAGTWTDDEILPLIVLPNHLCTRLAGARPILQNTVSEMRNLAENWNRSWVYDALGKRQGKIAADVVICRDIVGFAIGECKTAVHDAVR